MIRTLLLAGGLLNLAGAAFHLAFWRLFDWEADLAHLSAINRGIMETLNAAAIYLLVCMAAVSIYLATARLIKGFEIAIMLFIAGFYSIRALAEVPFFGWSGHGAAIVILSMLLSGCYVTAAALARSRRQRTALTSQDTSGDIASRPCAGAR